ncbi:uncharacterized protein LOC126816157 [Patella vulgata]|uniref:uncharacterized protein LOC126816157 n=1 Tax=Patella vulgata TaxID=6465 RepID=UPI00217FF2F6|nr:uncharacterized protein LOC126816157 [Patella vulgata]
MATKEKLFLPNHLCVLCGFSFLRQESNSIPVINNAYRLHLTEHRLNNIKEVMAPLDPTIAKEELKNNSVCTDCYKDIESYLKIEEKLTVFKMVLVERRLKVKAMYSTVQSLGVVKQDGKLVVTPSALTIQQKTGNISFRPAQNLCDQTKGRTAADLISLLAHHIEKKSEDSVPVPSANPSDNTNPGCQTTPSGQPSEMDSLSTELTLQDQTVQPKPPRSTFSLKILEGKAMHSEVEENISENTKGEPMDYQITLNETDMDQNASCTDTKIITPTPSQNHTGQFITQSTTSKPNSSSNSLIQCNIIRTSDGKLLLVPSINQDNLDKTAQKSPEKLVSLSSQAPSNQITIGQNSSGTKVFQRSLLPKQTGQVIMIPSSGPLISRSEEINTRSQFNDDGMSSLRYRTGQVITSLPQSCHVNQSELSANQQTNTLFVSSHAPQNPSKPGQSCSAVGSHKQRRENKMKVARTYLYPTGRQDVSSITPLNQHITDPSPITTINQPLSFSSNNVGGPITNNSVVTTIKEEMVDFAEPLSDNDDEVSEGSNHCSVLSIKEEFPQDVETEDAESANTNYELSLLDNQGGEVSNTSTGLEGFQTDNNALVCGICNLSFENTQLLLKHMQAHSDDKIFMCEYCEASFETSEILQTHVLTCLVLGRKNYKCHICGNCFPTDANLRHHLKTHAYKCDVCTKIFKCDEDFQKHLTLYKGKKVHTCETCGKNFHLLGGIITHRLIHTGEKNHKCDVCGCCFRTLFQLKRHLRVHSEERPYECDICFKRFKHVSNLTAHAFIHTGLRPHKCDICSKSFRCISSLHKHVLRHTNMKPHKCDICEMRFFVKRELVQHANTHWK